MIGKLVNKIKSNYAKIIPLFWNAIRLAFTSKTKLLVLVYIPLNSLKAKKWHDGFTAALDILKERFNYHVTILNLAKRMPTNKEIGLYDFVLVKGNWNFITDHFYRTNIRKNGTPSGLMISGVGTPLARKEQLKYNVLFYETNWYKQFIEDHPLTVQAFGIDTSVMKPVPNQTKDIDVLSVGTFAAYKRYDELFKYEGKKVILGHIDASQKETIKTLKENDVEVIDFVPYDRLSDYYNRSKTVVVPATIDGGGERCVLEAKACGVPVIVANDNEKLIELNNGPVLSHIDYAKQLDFGIKQAFERKKLPKNLIKPTEKIIVGRESFQNGNFQIRGDEEVWIGSFCAFGKNVSIITSNHDYNFAAIQGTFYKKNFEIPHPGETQNPPNKERTKGKVSIGHDVWIADNVTILSGVSIGNGSCIGASSLVTKDIPPFSIVGGVPAVVIKKRYSDEVINLLQLIKWWEWDEEKIKRNKAFFLLNLNKVSLAEITNILKK